MPGSRRTRHSTQRHAAIAASPESAHSFQAAAGWALHLHGYNTEVPAPAGTPAQHYDDENHPFRGQARFSLTQAMSSMLAL